jgi:hypothetical protein
MTKSKIKIELLPYSIIIALSFLSAVIFYEFPFQDFNGYEGMYLATPKISNLDFSTFSYFNWNGIYGEFGFTLLNSLFKSLNLEYTQTRFVLIFVIIMSKLLFFKIFGNDLFYAVPIYFLLIFPDDASLFRAGIASSSIAWAFLAYYHFKSKYLYFFIISIGAVFHISAILGLILIFTSKSSQIKRHYFLTLTLTLTLFYLLTLDSIYGYLYKKISSNFLEINDFNFFSGTIATLLIILLFYYFNQKRQVLSKNILVQYSLPIILVGFVSLVTLSFSQILSNRIFGLTYVFVVALTASICEVFRPIWVFRIISVGVLLFGFYILYYA